MCEVFRRQTGHARPPAPRNYEVSLGTSKGLVNLLILTQGEYHRLRATFNL
jgi:hypothetical protein